MSEETPRVGADATAASVRELGAGDIQAITKQEPVYLSPVNVAELQFGLALLPAGPRRQPGAGGQTRPTAGTSWS